MANKDKDPKKSSLLDEEKKTFGDSLDLHSNFALSDAVISAQKQFQSIAQPIVDAQLHLSDLSKSISEPILGWQKYYDETIGSALKTYPLYLGTGSAGADASSTTTQDKKTEVELAQLGEKVKKTQDAFKKTQDAIKKTQEAVENILETVASQKAELDDSKNAWEQEVATLRELVATMKMDIENGKEDLKKAKSELDNNKIKVIETLGIFTALFALITNASNGWPAPMFVAFAAIIFVFLFLLHFLLTGNEKVIETAKPIFRYSLILLILSLGIFIGSSWRSWLPENFVGIQFIFPERSEEAPLSLDSETPPATISPAVEIDAASD